MTRLDHQKINRNSKVDGPNPAVPEKKQVPRKKFQKSPSTFVKIVSKYINKCDRCLIKLRPNEYIYWNSKTSAVLCLKCGGKVLGIDTQ